MEEQEIRIAETKLEKRIVPAVFAMLPQTVASRAPQLVQKAASRGQGWKVATFVLMALCIGCFVALNQNSGGDIPAELDNSSSPNLVTLSTVICVGHDSLGHLNAKKVGVTTVPATERVQLRGVRCAAVLAFGADDKFWQTPCGGETGTCSLSLKPSEATN